MVCFKHPTVFYDTQLLNYVSAKQCEKQIYIHKVAYLPVDLTHIKNAAQSLCHSGRIGHSLAEEHPNL